MDEQKVGAWIRVNARKRFAATEPTVFGRQAQLDTTRTQLMTTTQKLERKEEAIKALQAHNR
jgi:hypothetical protein